MTGYARLCARLTSMYYLLCGLRLLYRNGRWFQGLGDLAICLWRDGQKPHPTVSSRRISALRHTTACFVHTQKTPDPQNLDFMECSDKETSVIYWNAPPNTWALKPSHVWVCCSHALPSTLRRTTSTDARPIHLRTSSTCSLGGGLLAVNKLPICLV